MEYQKQPTKEFSAFEEKITENLQSRIEGIAGYLFPLKYKIIEGNFEGHNLVIRFERNFIKIKSDVDNKEEISFLITNDKITGSDELASSVLNPVFRVFTDFKDFTLRFINKSIKTDLFKVLEKSKSSFEFYLHDGSDKDAVGITINSWVHDKDEFFDILRLFLKLKSKLK